MYAIREKMPDVRCTRGKTVKSLEVQIDLENLGCADRGDDLSFRPRYFSKIKPICSRAFVFSIGPRTPNHRRRVVRSADEWNCRFPVQCQRKVTITILYAEWNLSRTKYDVEKNRPRRRLLLVVIGWSKTLSIVKPFINIFVFHHYA